MKEEKERYLKEKLQHPKNSSIFLDILSSKKRKTSSGNEKKQLTTEIKKVANDAGEMKTIELEDKNIHNGKFHILSTINSYAPIHNT